MAQLVEHPTLGSLGLALDLRAVGLSPTLASTLDVEPT